MINRLLTLYTKSTTKRIIAQTKRKSVLPKSSNKLTEKIAAIDICPLCKNKITEDHIKSIKDETFRKQFARRFSKKETLNKLENLNKVGRYSKELYEHFKTEVK